uniref:hAT-like transposase RNase-H fold domain-containing protein n=1 Tax=Salix viminalis TaxID=40686 RepID=A0A6N2LG45_SALVM
MSLTAYWMDISGICIKEFLIFVKFSIIRFKCYAHIVNLIVCDGIKEINVLVVKIENTIRFVRFSPSRCAEKMHVQCKKSLYFDIAIRWKSTYLMLEVVEKLEKVFVRLGESEPRYISYFLEVDSKGNKKIEGHLVWRIGKMIFYMFTLRFSTSLHVTSNSFFNELIYMYTNLLQLCKSRDNLLSGMTMNMMLKFEKY